MKKPVILTLISYYLPGYKAGGPIRSLANLVEQLGDVFQFKIITRDRDFHETRVFADVRIDGWNQVGKASVYYASPKTCTLMGMRRIVQGSAYDALYLNSLFDPMFSILPLTLRRLRQIPQRPVVLAPRGELAPGALAIKPRKKQLFLRLARMVNLHRGVTWQASSPAEVADIRTGIAARARVMIGPMMAGHDFGTWLPRAAAGAENAKVPGELRLVLLGRISPMKNLDFTIEVLRSLRGEVTLDLYGPIDDAAYWQHCQGLLASLPAHITVRHQGSLPPAAVGPTLAGYDAFVLPTRGENFGHAILEALGSGLPVVISDRTPWRGLEAAGAGWDLPLEDPAGFTRVLQRCVDMDAVTLAAWKDAARAFAARVFDDPASREQNHRLFTTVLAEGSAS